MNTKYLLKAIGLGLLLGLIIYAIFRLVGLESNSTMVGAITGAVVGALIAMQSVAKKSKSNR